MSKNKYYISPKVRFEVLKRDGFRCAYCGRSSEEAPLEVDHIIPRVQGGSDDKSNLITACKECNVGKSGNTLVETNLEDSINHVVSTKIISKSINPREEKKLNFLNKYEHVRIYLKEIQSGKSAEEANKLAIAATGLNQSIRTTQRDIKQFKKVGMLKDDIITETFTDAVSVVKEYEKRLHAIEYTQNLNKGFSAYEANEMAGKITGISQSIRTTQRYAVKLRHSNI